MAVKKMNKLFQTAIGQLQAAQIRPGFTVVPKQILRENLIKLGLKEHEIKKYLK
jgi:hypothetical protein